VIKLHTSQHVYVKFNDKRKKNSNCNSAYASRVDGNAGTKLDNSQAPYTL